MSIESHYLLGNAAPEISTPHLDQPTTPQLALIAFHERSTRQRQQLAGFTANSVFQATLSATSQQAELEVMVHYAAPRTLQFRQMRSNGDSFVRRNVLIRILQSQADQVAKQERSGMAINVTNYKFSYKATGRIDDREVHIYEVKARRKRPGLFKGTIYLNAATGSLVRAAGTIVKSPSFFIRHIEFVQDYADLGDFTLPIRLHTVVSARFIGKVLICVSTRDYLFLESVDTDISPPMTN